MHWYGPLPYCVNAELSTANISVFVRRVFWTLGYPVPETLFQIPYLPHGSHELATLSLFAGKQHT